MNGYRSNRTCGCPRCRCRGLMAPAVLVTLGILFTLSEFGVANFDRTWPLLLIVIGLVKVFQGNAPTDGHMNADAPAIMPGGAPPAVGPESGKEPVHNA